jgi:single-stranded DNA-binding protein
MSNEAYLSVTGYVATTPEPGCTSSGVPTLSMRLGWTPRRLDQGTGEWSDEPTSFVTVKCYRKLADNGQFSLRRGDPVFVRGTLRVREYQAKDGSRGTAVEITATSIGHDLTKGITAFSKHRGSNGQARAEQAAADGESGAGQPGAVDDDGQFGLGGADDGAAAVALDRTEPADEMIEEPEDYDELAGEPVGARS